MAGSMNDSNRTYDNDQSMTADVCTDDGVNGAITVGTTAVEAKVGASVLLSRKYVIISPIADKVYFGFSNLVTTSTGIPLYRDQLIALPIGDGVSIWLIAESSNKEVRIGEIS